MTLDDYRIKCQWSRNELARKAGINYSTLNRVFHGQSISMQSASKLVTAISDRLGFKVEITDVSDLKVQ